MCIGYTDLNRTCLKDSYRLSYILKLVDNSMGYQLLSFVDVYLGYNKIPMFGPDQINIAFMIEQANYQYNVMRFRLKNVGAT